MRLQATALALACSSATAAAQTCETGFSADQPTLSGGFGTAIALNGGRLAVGVPDRDANAGAVELFTLDSTGSWVPDDVLEPTSLSGGDRFGETLDWRGRP